MGPFEDPPVAKFLFGSPKMAPLWLIARVYVGWAWLQAGWGKINNPAWTGADTGKSLTGFLKGALAKTEGAHPDVQQWYAWFIENIVLPNASTWSVMIAWGEFLVGLALILGLFTGIAAFFGAFMNLNFLFAGAVSTNPLLFTLSIGLVLAWKVAGFWGLDSIVLPLLGTPWSPGYVFSPKQNKNGD
jgi:thiosulfate dehydrogenase [quinone] large subunit